MDFVPFEIAKKLKEKGFKLACIGHYEGDRFEYNTYDGYDINISYIARSYNDDNRFDEYTDLPVICQVLKWLREEKNIHISPVLWGRGWYVDIQSFTKETDEDYVSYDVDNKFQSIDYETYEKAVIAGVNYCLENLI